MFRRFGLLSLQDGVEPGPEPTVGQRAVMAARLASEHGRGNVRFSPNPPNEGMWEAF